MIDSPHRLLTLRRAVSTVFVSATLVGAFLAAGSGLAACGSADTTEPDSVSGKTDASGDGGVVVVVTTADAATTSDGGKPTTNGDATTYDPFAVDAGPPIGGYAASHPPFPTILNSGGKTITSPKFVLLSWDGYDYESEVEEMMSRLGGSAYWTTVTGEYGIGAATYGGRVSLGDKPLGAYNDYDLQNLLTESFGKVAGLGSPDPDTVYFFLMPKSTGVTFQGGTAAATSPATTGRPVWTTPAWRPAPSPTR